MASAEELRKFVTARFLRESIEALPDEEDFQLWHVYRQSPDEVSTGLIDPAIRSVGALVEREGWHTLGARLAYLNDPKCFKLLWYWRKAYEIRIFQGCSYSCNAATRRSMSNRTGLMRRWCLLSSSRVIRSKVYVCRK